MKTLAMKKLKSTLTNPIKSKRNLFNLGIFGALDRSRIMNPRPPIVKRKLDARPSIIYCPFTLKEKINKGEKSQTNIKEIIYISNPIYSICFICTNTGWLTLMAAFLTKASRKLMLNNYIKTLIHNLSPELRVCKVPTSAHERIHIYLCILTATTQSKEVPGYTDGPKAWHHDLLISILILGRTAWILLPGQIPLKALWQHMKHILF